MKKIGIIGGLGPLATVDFFGKIVNNTDAKRDQDNIPILIYNNPQIPDRTQAILYGAESPVPEIVRTGKLLELMGADFLCIPCNTSFYFFEEIQGGLDLEVLNMIELTVNEVKEKKLKKVCVLGTEGTLKSGIYRDLLVNSGIEVYEPSEYLMGLLTEVIYEMVKKNEFGGDISRFDRELKRIVVEEGVEEFILACTELPIAFSRFNLDYKTVDPTLVLALEAIRLSK